MTSRIIQNLKAGVTEVVPYTAEEQAEHEAKIVAELAAPPKVPDSVPKWAALHALIDADMDTMPQSYFASLTGKDKKKAQTKWNADPTLRRDSPILSAAISAGIITSPQVDALMIEADRISRG